MKNERERDDHQHRGQRVPHLACGHEREVGFLVKNSTWSAGSSTDRQAVDLAPAAVHEREQRAAAHERGEHRSDDAERQHDGEAADRAASNTTEPSKRKMLSLSPLIALLRQ